MGLGLARFTASGVPSDRRLSILHCFRFAWHCALSGVPFFLGRAGADRSNHDYQRIGVGDEYSVECGVYLWLGANRSLWRCGVWHRLGHCDVDDVIDGSAVCTGIASYFAFGLLALDLFGLPSWRNGIRDLLALGVPNTLALLFEVSLFSFIALFIAQLGAVVIAAHQVAISYTSMVFMIPLSMAMAITVRTGLAYGQGRLQAVKQSLATGIGFSGLVSLVTAGLTYWLAYPIAALYSPDADVITLAGSLLWLAAMYQLFDAVQVGCAGALRGLHSTRIIMVVTFISYWLIGLGLGYALAFGDWFWAPQG